jgi:hypothetical protein
VEIARAYRKRGKQWSEETKAKSMKTPTLPKLSEAQFTAQVIAFAKLHGWKCAHFRPGRTARGWRTAVQGDGVGFPDLVLVRKDTMMVAELKVGRRQPTAEQDAWLAAFQRCDVPVFVWTPADWEQIEFMLT